MIGMMRFTSKKWVIPILIAGVISLGGMTAAPGIGYAEVVEGMAVFDGDRKSVV